MTIFLIGLVVFNVVGTAAKKYLDKVAPTGKADSIVGAVLKLAQTALSYVTANTTTLTPSQKAAINAGSAVQTAIET